MMNHKHPIFSLGLMQNADVDLYAADLPQDEQDLFRLNQFLVFDSEYAIQLVPSEQELREILTLMIENHLVLSDVEKMKAARQVNDWDKIQQLAHKIKGGAVYIGAFKMKMACQYLERYWKIGKSALLDQSYQQMLEVIDETLKEVKQWLED